MLKCALKVGFLLVFFTQSFAQSGFEVRGKVGFLAAHHAGMAHMPKQLAVATELTYFKRLTDNYIWQKSYRQPLVGSTLFIGSVGNNEILGRYVGVYGFAELPVIKYKKYRMDWKFSTGIGYTNKPYDPVSNPKNVAIGSHLNALMCFALKQTFGFRNSAITLSMDMTHFSNGAFKVPNLGINLPYLSLGYQHYIIGIKKKATRDYEVIKKDAVYQIKPRPMKNFLTYQQWQLSLNGIFTAKETMPIGGKKYPVYAGSISLRRYGSYKSGLEVNLDVLSKQALLNYEPMVEKSQLDILQLGLSASYILPLDRFNFVYGAGVYIRDKYRADGPLYIRLGCRYYVTKNISAVFGLKTHYAKADYLEFGLSYHIIDLKK
ncbi:MAG: hypothetical protein RJB36_1273 [Bacteroidota bacterium]